MKKLYLLLLCGLYVQSLFSQIEVNSQWTWIKGDSVPEQKGVYGTRGVPAASNKPGARYGAVTWTDTTGNLWLFGGNGRIGYFNDLWKYDPHSNHWTWKKGDSIINQFGVYGTQGVPDVTNKPGARIGTVSWTDTSGNLWLFGGSGYAASSTGGLNDLWKYDPHTNQWTWMKGDNIPDQIGVYGTQGVPVATNKPGTRHGAVSWTDASGELWLFGGVGYTASSSGWLNDLWKYDPHTNQWIWMKGDSTNQTGVYGTRGVPAATNKPGARNGAVTWTDTTGNLWLFGGDGFVASSYAGYLNDLWKYDPHSNHWTWINGDSIPYQFGVYGTQGVPDVTNKPGARIGAVSWTDASGNLWLFGGDGHAALLNDFWKYDPNTNQWTWTKGDNIPNQFGVYGTHGVPAATNKPGGRHRAVSWTDGSGDLWLSGGAGRAASSSGLLNDLWKLTDEGFNQPPSVTITSPVNNTSYPAGSTINLNATVTDSDGTVTKVEFYNNGIKFAEDNAEPYGFTGTEVSEGNYVLTAKAFDNSGDSTVSDTVRITVTACTPSGSISAEGYANIPGGNVSDLTSHPSYPNSPAVTAQLGSFEYGPNYGDNYGARVRGYICVPETGYYTFYIAGDDQSGLWLSTDENPANKVLIAYAETWVNFRSWFTYPTQRSAPIRLIKGVRYYIETLHKEAVSPDHLSVAWTLPDGTFEAPIPGSRLSPWASTPGGIRAPGFREAMEAVQGFSVQATPNPSSNHFTLITKTDRKEFITITVTDVMGRVVERKQNVAPNTSIQFGNTYRTGVYFVEVRQGIRREKLKLIRK
jgi:N-acetylneuraminic acid mutarotase